MAATCGNGYVFDKILKKKKKKPVLLRCKLPETLCMAHSNCGKRIKLIFIDLNFRMNK